MQVMKLEILKVKYFLNYYNIVKQLISKKLLIIYLMIIISYDESLKIEPIDLAWINKGDAFTELKKYNEAIKWYNKIIIFIF